MNPENTSDRDPIIHLLGAMSDGTSGYIEGMEAQGQRQMVASEVLPVRAPWDELEKLGFVRDEPVEGDRLFCRATLPAGWRKEPSDHSMWSYVVDEQGRRRVAVFYKAAFYDRDAFASVTQLSGYIMSVAHGNEKLVIDDEWATPAAIRVAISSGLASEQERIEDFERCSMTDAANRARGTVAKLHTVLSSLPPGSERS